MAKQTWKPGNMLYPLPAVMVSVTDGEGNDNIITVAWAGTVCTNPPMVSISVRPSRFSYDMICKTKEFVPEPYHRGAGIRYRLLRCALRQRCRQIPGASSYQRKGRSCESTNDRRVTCKYRMQGEKRLRSLVPITCFLLRLWQCMRMKPTWIKTINSS